MNYLTRMNLKELRAYERNKKQASVILQLQAEAVRSDSEIDFRRLMEKARQEANAASGAAMRISELEKANERLERTGSQADRPAA